MVSDHMNNQIYFFDTSFLVALMYVSDAHRDDAISYITTLDQDRVDYYINEHIFFELVTWMTYRQ